MQQNLTLSGRYRLDSLIGRGGMGEVWRATDLRLERSVAVKLLPVDQVGDTPAMRRFEREATAAAALRHRGIAVVFDSGADDESNRVFFVMELLDGEDLQHLLVRTPEGLDPERIRDFGTQIASALAEAHGQGVVHRDIKPANIILLPDGDLKICDFGVARVAAHSGSLTKGAVGTPLYMAPEQLRAETIDGRADLYSLGCLLYALATGRPPFKADALPALLYQHMTAVPQPVTELRPDFPAGLEALIMQCLAKEPEDRPASARDLADAFGRADLAETVPSARSGSAPAVPTAPAVPGAPVPTASAVSVPAVPVQEAATVAPDTSVQDLVPHPQRSSPWPKIGMVAAAVAAVVAASAVTFALAGRGGGEQVVVVQQAPLPTEAASAMPAVVSSSPAASTSARAKKNASNGSSEDPLSPTNPDKAEKSEKPAAKPSQKASKKPAVPRPQHVPSNWALHRPKKYQGTQCTLLGAEYLLEISDKPGAVSFCALTSAQLENVAIDTNVTLFGSSCASLSLRRNKPVSYEFVLCADGATFTRKWTTAGQPPALLAQKKALSPVEGSIRLTAVINGSALSFYANGNLLTTLQDNGIKAGGISLGSSVLKDSQKSIMSFHKLTVWCPKGSGACS